MFRWRFPLGSCFSLHAGVFVRDMGPILVATGLVASVVVGGNGLNPREFGQLVHEQAALRLGVILAWALLVRSATRRQLYPPGAAWLRSSPISGGIQWALCAVFILAAQIFPTLLLLVGGQPLEALVFALGAGTLVCAGGELVTLATVPMTLIAIVVPRTGILPAITTLALLGTFIGAMTQAYRNASVGARWRGIRFRRLPAILHLVLTLLRELHRGRSAALLESGALSLACALWFANSLRADPPADQTRLLSVSAILAGLGSAPLLATVGRVRRVMLPWIRATPTPHSVALLAGLLVLTTPSFAFAATLPFVGPSTAPEGVMSWAYGVALCAVLLRAEHALHARRRDARTLLVLTSVGIIGVFLALAQAPLRWGAAVGSVLFAFALFKGESESRRVEDS